jgi:hypothetical protein
VAAASTAEGIQLDETAGEAMGIERAKEWRQVVTGTSARWAASGKARKRGLWTWADAGSRCGEGEVKGV